ncbi:MAG: NADPH:quinone reductase [Burkholderiaceae bacterium]
MKAVWYDRTGAAADVLVSGELPTPLAGPGEVRVRLHASGVNPADCNRRAGKGYAMEFPRIVPNSDGSGVIDQVGAGVDATLLGQRVWLYNGQRGRAFGTAAQYIALDADLVSPLPEAVSFEQGACLGIPGMTAYHCVFIDGPVRGKTVLVQGGAGAVGHFAVQLAAWGGACVWATADGDVKSRHASAAGAEAVIDWRSEDVAARVLELSGGQGADLVVEVDFGGNLAADIKLLKPNGSIVAYASRGDSAPKMPFYELMRKNLTLRTVLLPGTPLESRRNAQRGLGQWLSQGPAFITVSQVFDLDHTAEAHVAVESGTKLGTVIVRCDRAESIGRTRDAQHAPYDGGGPRSARGDSCWAGAYTGSTVSASRGMQRTACARDCRVR